jgi:hypothetical protein
VLRRRPLEDGHTLETAKGYWEMSLARSRELLHLFCEQMLGLPAGALRE